MWKLNISPIRNSKIEGSIHTYDIPFKITNIPFVLIVYVIKPQFTTTTTNEFTNWNDHTANDYVNRHVMTYDSNKSTKKWKKKLLNFNRRKEKKEGETNSLVTARRLSTTRWIIFVRLDLLALGSSKTASKPRSKSNSKP